MKIIDLFESPLMGYKTLSDTRNTKTGDVSSISDDPEKFNQRSSSYTDKRDKALLTNPASVKRMHNMFDKTDTNFYFYMINSKEARKHTEVGVVDRAWLEKEMPTIAPFIGDHTDNDGITILFTNNKGAEKFPMTPWIMAHRIAHVFARGAWKVGGRPISTYTTIEKLILHTTIDILKTYYGYGGSGKEDSVHKKFYEAIGTFRSARKSSLRQDFEFLHELFAQYLISGNIKFNVPPKKIVLTKAWGHDAKTLYFRGDIEELNNDLESLASGIEYYIEDMLSEATNRIFVM